MNQMLNQATRNAGQQGGHQTRDQRIGSAPKDKFVRAYQGFTQGFRGFGGTQSQKEGLGGANDGRQAHQPASSFRSPFLAQHRAPFAQTPKVVEQQQQTNTRKQDDEPLQSSTQSRQQHASHEISQERPNQRNQHVVDHFYVPEVVATHHDIGDRAQARDGKISGAYRHQTNEDAQAERASYEDLLDPELPSAFIEQLEASERKADGGVWQTQLHGGDCSTGLKNTGSSTVRDTSKPRSQFSPSGGNNTSRSLQLPSENHPASRDAVDENLGSGLKTTSLAFVQELGSYESKIKEQGLILEKRYKDLDQQLKEAQSSIVLNAETEAEEHSKLYNLMLQLQAKLMSLHQGTAENLEISRGIPSSLESIQHDYQDSTHLLREQRKLFEDPNTGFAAWAEHAAKFGQELQNLRDTFDIQLLQASNTEKVFSERNDDLIAKLAAIGLEKQSLEQDVRRLGESSAELKLSLSEKTLQLQNSEAQKNELEKTVIGLQKDVELANKQMEASNTNAKERECALQKQCDQVEASMAAKVEIQQKRIEEAEQKKKDYVHSGVILKAENQALQKAQAEDRAKIVSLEEQVGNLKGEIKLLQHRLESASATQKEQIDALREGHTSELKALIAIKADLSSELDNLRQQNRDLLQQSAMATENNNRLSQQITDSTAINMKLIDVISARSEEGNRNDGGFLSSVATPVAGQGASVKKPSVRRKPKSREDKNGNESDDEQGPASKRSRTETPMMERTEALFDEDMPDLDDIIECGSHVQTAAPKGRRNAGDKNRSTTGKKGKESDDQQREEGEIVA